MDGFYPDAGAFRPGEEGNFIAAHPGSRLRQLGDQETNIVPIVRNIAKYAQFVDDPLAIRYHLEKAFFLTTHDRPGPCWLDIPLDVQASLIDPAELAGFSPDEEYPPRDTTALPAICREILERIHGAKAPILAGSGVRHTGALAEFETVIRGLGVPVVVSRTAHDLLPTGDALRCGRAGIDAERAGNIAVANADVLLVLGSRMGVRLTGYNFGEFAPKAFVYQVDVDPAELSKPTRSRRIAGLRHTSRPFLAELARQVVSLTPSSGMPSGWNSPRSGSGAIRSNRAAARAAREAESLRLSGRRL